MQIGPTMLEPGPHTPSCSLPLERGRGGDAGAERRPARERDRGERVQRRDARGLPAPGAFARGPRDPPQAGPTIARQPVLARCRRGRHALLLTGVWRTPPLPSPVLPGPAEQGESRSQDQGLQGRGRAHRAARGAAAVAGRDRPPARGAGKENGLAPQRAGPARRGPPAR